MTRPGIVEMRLSPLFYSNGTVHGGLLDAASNNAGVSPPTLQQGREFIKEYVRGFQLANEPGGMVAIFGVPEERAFVEQFAPHAMAIHNRAIEPFYAGRFFGNADKPWSSVLEDKILLVVHPFELSIQRQYFRHHNAAPLLMILMFTV